MAWGYARAANALGVDIVEGIDATGITTTGARITGVETDRGPIACDQVGIAAAGAVLGRVTPLGGRLPIHIHAIQAFVSEPVQPLPARPACRCR